MSTTGPPISKSKGSSLPERPDSRPPTPDSRLLMELLAGRRSVRRYTSQKVPAEVVRGIVEAARWAPSPHNAQPWRFAVLRSAAARQRLALALGERWRADLTADGLPAEQVDALIGRSRERINGAPISLVIGLTWADLDVYPDERRQEAERLMAAHSLGAAVQNIMLAAHAHGLATCWMCAPLFCPAVVREALGLPAELVPQALITLGYPDSVPPPRKKRELDELIVFDA